MLIREAPPNLNDYIGFDEKMNTVLQETGKFNPMYYWNNFYYYLIDDEMLNFLKEGK